MMMIPIFGQDQKSVQDSKKKSGQCQVTVFMHVIGKVKVLIVPLSTILSIAIVSNFRRTIISKIYVNTKNSFRFQHGNSETNHKNDGDCCESAKIVKSHLCRPETQTTWIPGSVCPLNAYNGLDTKLMQVLSRRYTEGT